MACPTCSEDGEYFAGTPKAEALFFLGRMLWASHRARQAEEKKERPSRVALDELASIAFRLDDLITGIIEVEFH
jgi:hypothetical protein